MPLLVVGVSMLLLVFVRDHHPLLLDILGIVESARCGFTACFRREHRTCVYMYRRAGGAAGSVVLGFSDRRGWPSARSWALPAVCPEGARLIHDCTKSHAPLYIAWHSSIQTLSPVTARLAALQYEMYLAVLPLIDVNAKERG
ncbi:hypothetical protein DL93DRAFT_936654 [Clavulina sp. PMI_390]|nr:hypothetical protein DL93DRAFT_936654 [Clavulina sp. PMI_390]